MEIYVILFLIIGIFILMMGRVFWLISHKDKEEYSLIAYRENIDKRS